MYKQQPREQSATVRQREQVFLLGERVRYLMVMWETVSAGTWDRGVLQRLRDEVYLLIAAAEPVASGDLERTLHALAQCLAAIEDGREPPPAPQCLRVSEALAATEALVGRIG